MNKITIRQVLAHPIGLEALMDHAGREFCMENILFLIEALQFQQWTYDEIILPNSDSYLV